MNTKRLGGFVRSGVAALVIALGLSWGAGWAQAPAASQPLVSNVFLETDIRAALQDLAQQSGCHIIPDDTVRGTVSLDIKQLPLEEALRLVLMSGGYSFRKVGESCYLVGRCDPESPTFNLLSTTAIIPLRYLKAERAADLPLSDYYKEYIKLDPKRNALIVTGPQDLVDRVAADVARIDSARAQVRIDAVIADVQTERAREFLPKWHVTSNVADSKGTSTVSFENLTLGYTSLHMREVLFSIKALVSNGIASVRAAPSITTLDGEQAQIFVGKDEYFTILSGGTLTFPYFQLQSVKSGITLAVLPRIVEDNLITLQFSPEVSDVVARGEQGLPVVSRRTVTTTVRVMNGETVVVGGLTSELVRKTRTGVPILRDIPLIGGLFTSSESSTQKSEVLVMLTPHIIRGPGLEGASAAVTSEAGPGALPAPVAPQSVAPAEPQVKRPAPADALSSAAPGADGPASGAVAPSAGGAPAPKASEAPPATQSLAPETGTPTASAAQPEQTAVPVAPAPNRVTSAAAGAAGAVVPAWPVETPPFRFSAQRSAPVGLAPGAAARIPLPPAPRLPSGQAAGGVPLPPAPGSAPKVEAGGA